MLMEMTLNEKNYKIKERAMTVEKRLENALSIIESIKNGKISPNNLYDLQLHLIDALDQVKELRGEVGRRLNQMKNKKNDTRWI